MTHRYSCDNSYYSSKKTNSRTWMENDYDIESSNPKGVNASGTNDRLVSHGLERRKERPQSVCCESTNSVCEANERENSDIGDEDDDLDYITSDDAGDEDWIASDHEKKRPVRGSNTNRNQTPGFRKPLNSSNSSRRSSQRDRNQRNLGRSSHQNSLSNRVSTNKQNITRSVGRPKNHSRDQIGHLNAYHGTSTRKCRRPIEKHEATDVKSSKSSGSQLAYELTKPRQCFGPGCTRPAARPETKYCSRECGLKLAINRLEVLLRESFETCYPDIIKRLDQYEEFSELPDCMADEIDKTRLEEIRAEQCAVHDRLVELEMDHQRLTSLISRAQERKCGRSNEQMMAAVAKDAEQVEQLDPIICVTCSTEVSMKHALKHMEKCFQKMEGNTVFCANQKEQIMGTPLFCDAYDSQAKAYCKRLRVVCEHYKEPKLPTDTVCGSPLVRDVFVETGEFCCVPRNKCTKHFGWERLRRAKIDLERYRCLIQMDELMQEEQRIRRSMSQRGGILGILLHRTIDHNPSRPIPLPPEFNNRL